MNGSSAGGCCGGGDDIVAGWVRWMVCCVLDASFVVFVVAVERVGWWLLEWGEGFFLIVLLPSVGLVLLSTAGQKNGSCTLL